MAIRRASGAGSSVGGNRRYSGGGQSPASGMPSVSSMYWAASRFCSTWIRHEGPMEVRIGGSRDSRFSAGQHRGAVRSGNRAVRTGTHARGISRGSDCSAASADKSRNARRSWVGSTSKSATRQTQRNAIGQRCNSILTMFRRSSMQSPRVQAPTRLVMRWISSTSSSSSGGSRATVCSPFSSSPVTSTRRKNCCGSYAKRMQLDRICGMSGRLWCSSSPIWVWRMKRCR